MQLGLSWVSRNPAPIPIFSIDKIAVMTFRKTLNLSARVPVTFHPFLPVTSAYTIKSLGTLSFLVALKYKPSIIIRSSMFSNIAFKQKHLRFFSCFSTTVTLVISGWNKRSYRVGFNTHSFQMSGIQVLRLIWSSRTFLQSVEKEEHHKRKFVFYILKLCLKTKEISLWRYVFLFIWSWKELEWLGQTKCYTVKIRVDWDEMNHMLNTYTFYRVYCVYFLLFIQCPG